MAFRTGTGHQVVTSRTKPGTCRASRHGIPGRTARNAALAALTADLRSPILADVTGMHRRTELR
jgi:hypothetical protein